MNREETIYTINKLVKQYVKRSQNISNKLEKMTEINEKNHGADFNEVNELAVEHALTEEFIDDLVSLMREIKDA